MDRRRWCRLRGRVGSRRRAGGLRHRPRRPGDHGLCERCAARRRARARARAPGAPRACRAVGAGDAGAVCAGVVRVNGDRRRCREPVHGVRRRRCGAVHAGQWRAARGRDGRSPAGGVMDVVDHVVLGARAVGLAVAEALARRGEPVRVVNRSGLREPLRGVQSAAGDISDPAFAAAVTRGARVVYQALNPPYHRWAQEFPGLQAAAIAAAQAADARLVVMDNVYMYGRADGRPFTEDRSYEAHTRKGRVRAAMARDLMAAHDAGRVRVSVGRASDFFGPRAGGQSLIGDRVIPAALADKAASVMGDPDMPHTYTFVPDIGENLVRLGERDDALGRVWHLPSPETRTTREVVALVYRAGGTEPQLKVTPAWQMRALGLVNRTVREINEMRYEFDEPFVVDASRAETELGLRAPPLADAVQQTVHWYRAQAGPSSAADHPTPPDADVPIGGQPMIENTPTGPGARP